MIKRELTPIIKQLQTKYPVLSIIGPRQSGKTSLVQYLFANYQYYNLENPDTLAFATADPKTFLKIGLGEKMVIDEVQRLPVLLSYIQVEVDAQQIDGQFVLTGSQNFALSQAVSQSLAGRVANLTLLPLSIRELLASEYYHKTIDHGELSLTGFYPRRLVKDISPTIFYRDYLSTYVERDLRQLKNIGDLGTFQKFILLLAGRVGQLVNYNSLANDVGVDHKTIMSWISVLEASYIVFKLHPYYANFGKRVIKSPKIYFYDVGLLCYLLKIGTAEQLTAHFASGQIFENLVIAEHLKNTLNSKLNQQLYFWRDSGGNEVDLVIDRGEVLQGIEIKAGQTFSTQMLRGLNVWRALDSARHLTALVYTGEHQQPVGDHQVANWLSFITQPPQIS